MRRKLTLRYISLLSVMESQVKQKRSKTCVYKGRQK